jgi:cell division initiation protein
MTPEELRDRSFPVRFRGFDRRRVRAWLDDAAAELERLTAGEREAREECRRLAAALQRSERREEEWERLADELGLADTVGSTGALPPSATRDGRPNPTYVLRAAKEQSQIIVREAEQRARRVIEKANAVIAELRDDIGQLAERRRAFVARMRTLLDAQKDFLASVEGMPDDGALPPERSAAPAGFEADEIRAILDKLDRELGAVDT